MKKLLKKLLPKWVYNFLKDVKKTCRIFPLRLVSGIIQLLPDSFKIYIKTHTTIIHPLDNKGERILINVDSDIEYTTRLHSCAKEPEMEEWFDNYFKPGDTFYDIGANVGAYSLIPAKLFKGYIKIYAFEPSFPNFYQLNKNIFINQVQNAIISTPIALSDVTGLSVFHYNNLTTGGALHSLGQAVDFKGEEFAAVFQQTVLTFALDDIIKCFNLSFPQHI